MNDSSVNIFQNYCDSTKTTFFLNISAILLILLFIINPLNIVGYKQYIGKIMIVIILGYSLYVNIASSYSLFSINNMVENNYLGRAKYNILLNVICCILLFMFIMYIMRHMFD